MDVDEEEDATVRPKQINDYGIEVDFESLDDDDREVSLYTRLLCSWPKINPTILLGPQRR